MHQLIHDIIVTQYGNNLNALKNILNKAKTHAETNKFDPNKFMDTKLAPDMMNFTKQIQILSDNAKGAVARLAAAEIPSFSDDEKTFDELIERVNKTINFISKFKADDFKNYQDQKVSFFWKPNQYLKGHDYLVSFAIPNFYFHLTTAYSLLRSGGVQIGKGDFLGEVNWKSN